MSVCRITLVVLLLVSAWKKTAEDAEIAEGEAKFLPGYFRAELVAADYVRRCLNLYVPADIVRRYKFG